MQTGNGNGDGIGKKRKRRKEEEEKVSLSLSYVCLSLAPNRGCVCVCVCKPVSQEKAKTVTFANDDMVLHYGGPHRHRRKSTPASLNRTPLHHHHHPHHHHHHQSQPSHHHQQHLLQQHVLRSSPVSSHLRHWLTPGNSSVLEMKKMSKLEARLCSAMPLARSFQH